MHKPKLVNMNQSAPKPCVRCRAANVSLSIDALFEESVQHHTVWKGWLKLKPKQGFLLIGTTVRLVMAKNLKV